LSFIRYYQNSQIMRRTLLTLFTLGLLFSGFGQDTLWHVNFDGSDWAAGDTVYAKDTSWFSWSGVPMIVVEDSSNAYDGTRFVQSGTAGNAVIGTVNVLEVGKNYTYRVATRTDSAAPGWWMNHTISVNASFPIADSSTLGIDMSKVEVNNNGDYTVSADGKARYLYEAGRTNRPTLVNSDTWVVSEFTFTPLANLDTVNFSVYRFKDGPRLYIDAMEAICNDCAAVVPQFNVTFSVDMSDEVVDATGMFLGADFDNWSGGIAMEDNDNDSIWTVTVPLDSGEYEYKFINGANWMNGGESLDSINQAACTKTTGVFTNRIMTVSSDTSICTPKWELCCGQENNNTRIFPSLVEKKLFSVRPTRTHDRVIIEPLSSGAQLVEVMVMNATGQFMQRINFRMSEGIQRLDVGHYAPGIYLVQLKVGQQIQIQKILVD
jgi:hypothetical protein